MPNVSGAVISANGALEVSWRRGPLWAGGSAASGARRRPAVTHACPDDAGAVSDCDLATAPGPLAYVELSVNALMEHTTGPWH